MANIRCCGKTPELMVYDLSGKTAKSKKAYWLKCTVCGRSNSYSYDCEDEAKDAWNKGLTGIRH